MDKIKVIIKRPDELIGHVCWISNTLENLQRNVGGYIETLTILRNPDVIIIMNEDGKLDDSKYNFKIPGDQIFGDIIVCGRDGENFADVPISRQTWNSILLGWGTDMNMKILGYNIISVMHKKEISMSELSRRMKCDRGNLYYRITNPESMKVKQLVRIGNAIGVDWRDLMEGVDE